MSDPIPQRIYEFCDAKFKQLGIKGVTMDDIALGLGISKKTIYQYYKDKNALVLDWAKQDLETQKCVVDDIIKADSSDAIKQVLDISIVMEGKLKERHPILIQDLQKFHPKAWALFQEFQVKYIYQKVKANLELGVKDGLYRNDINIDITAILRLQFINYVFISYAELGAKFSISEIMKQFTDIYLHGICTLKGHKLINKYKQITEDE